MHGTQPLPNASSARMKSIRRSRPLRKRRPSPNRSEEHTSELQSLMRISYAVFCLKKKKKNKKNYIIKNKKKHTIQSRENISNELQMYNTNIKIKIYTK